MDGKLVRFTNCNILRDHIIYEDDIWVYEGKFIDPQVVFYDYKTTADETIDLNGALVAPGFIDIQINGGFGIDFAHDLLNTPDGLDKVAKGILSHGVTSFCPTLVSSKSELYHKVLSLLKPRKGGICGAEILGAHTEGPFISINKKGAHEPQCISDFENGIDSIQEMYGDISNIKIITLAPEKENCLEVIRWLTLHKIIVCLGHSEADIETGELAVHSGAKIITHMFNAMLPFHHRNPGLIGLIGSSTLKHPPYYGLIADGIHTHPSSLRIAFGTHPTGSILVTDAVSAMGLDVGKHHIGGQQIDVLHDRAVISDTDTLCGSIAPMDKCIRIFVESTKCSTVEALEAASLHPALALGIENSKGRLNFGCDADFVVLSSDLFVLSTWIAGECVYTNIENVN